MHSGSVEIALNF